MSSNLLVTVFGSGALFKIHPLEDGGVEVGLLAAALEAAKTKRYALSRLRRMLLAAALGVRDGDSRGMPPYLRVLAANARGFAVLREMRKQEQAE